MLKSDSGGIKGIVDKAAGATQADILAVISKRQVQALSLYYYDNVCVTEIAEIMGISRNSVYKLIRRGTRHLQEAGIELTKAKVHRPKLIYLDPTDMDKFSAKEDNAE